MPQTYQLDAFSFLVLSDGQGKIADQFNKILEERVKVLHVAKGVREWLLMYKVQKPNILICDSETLAEAEFSALRKLREINPRIPVIVAMHEGSEYSIDRFSSFGHIYFLHEPYDLEIFKDILLSAGKSVVREWKIHQTISQLGANFDRLPHLVVMTDEEGNLKECNQRVLDYFGFPDLQKLHEKFPHFGRLFVPKKGYVKPTEDENWLKALKSRPSGHRKVVFNDRNDRQSRFSATIDRMPQGYIVSFTDITVDENILQNKIAELEQDASPELRAWKEVQNHINKEIHRARRYDVEFTLMIFCIFDPDSGVEKLDRRDDRVFPIIEKLIGKLIRPTDYLGKWERNRYVVLASQTGTDGAKKFIRRISDEIGANHFVKQNDFTLKFGISHFRENDNSNLMLKRANNALSIAIKEDGREFVTDDTDATTLTE